MNKKIEKRLERDQQKYEREQLMKEKRSEDYKVLGEVFDNPTLIVVYQLIDQGVIKEIFGVIKSGKESRVYAGLGDEGREIAIKIYLTTSAEFKRGMLPYLLGDPRFSGIKKDMRSLTYAWAQKEFRNLQKASEVGIPVPHPIHVEKNVLVMEFIGEEGVPAPTLKELPPTDPQKVYQALLDSVKTLYTKGKLVHSDLSEYNIMHRADDPVIFDMAQAVHIEHPMATQFLLRDLTTINRFFKKLGVNVTTPDSLYEWVTGDE